MNKYKWSSLHNSFFPTATINDYLSAGWDLSDLIDISDDVYLEFGSYPPEGKLRGVISGMPAWIEAPPMTDEELIVKAKSKRDELRAIADYSLTPLQDAVDLSEATDEEIALWKAWKKYRVLLMRVDPAAPVWPTLPVA